MDMFFKVACNEILQTFIHTETKMRSSNQVKN